MQGEHFYATKLVSPPLPPALVARPRLVELLNRSTDGALTLVSAPAGAGKTTALAAWMASAPAGGVAWLPLDPEDGQRLRFWTETVAALGRASSAPGSLPAASPDRLDAFLPSLVNALAELDEPLTLVLDDFQEAASPEVVADVGALIEHAPERLHVVIATRSDPPLRLQRLRLAGRLAEIRASDLAFTLDEAGELIAAIGVGLGGRDVDRLWRRTEGWAAGLRLAALSLQGRSDPSAFVSGFAGSDHAVSDYLLREVIARQPPPTLDLLLRISILDRVNGDLADALTGADGADETLELLAYRDGLATALDQPAGWYRVNGLLVEVLRVELRRRMPHEIADLHRRAAQWHAEQGLVAEAERHALEADAKGSARAMSNGRLREPLSERELAVLRFLPTALSNAEIAAELYVSVNTVKTHLKHVYRKLDAHDRRAAVRRACDLRLLGSGLDER